MKAFNEMKVAELKQESRDRGLKLEHKGHKFTKAELITQLEEFEKGLVKAEERLAGEEENKTEVVETKQETQPVEVKAETEANDDEYIPFAYTLDEIEKRYGGRKKQKVYDHELEVGSFVVFIHYVEAKDGNIYKKLRTAKVEKISRKREMVEVSTLLGTVKQLSFDELLYIKKNQAGCNYPLDISMFLKKQRTEKGRELINEKLERN